MKIDRESIFQNRNIGLFLPSYAMSACFKVSEKFDIRKASGPH